MLKSDVVVGGHYYARISGKIVVVRLDNVRVTYGREKDRTVYDVTNTATGRRTTFRSAAKFRGKAKEPVPIV